MKTIILFAVFVCCIQLALCVHNKHADQVLIGELYNQKILGAKPLGTLDDETAQKVDQYFMDHTFLKQCSKPYVEYLRNLGVDTFFHIALELDDDSEHTMSPTVILNGKLVPLVEKILNVFEQFSFYEAGCQVSEKDDIKASTKYLKKVIPKLVITTHMEKLLYSSPVLHELRNPDKVCAGIFLQYALVFTQHSQEQSIQHNDDIDSAESDSKLEDSDDKNSDDENSDDENSDIVGEHEGVNTANAGIIAPRQKENKQKIQIEHNGSSNAMAKFGSVSKHGSNAIKKENVVPLLISTRKKDDHQHEIEPCDKVYEKIRFPFLVKLRNKTRTSVSSESNCRKERRFNSKSKKVNKELELANNEPQPAKKSNKFGNFFK